MRSEIRKLPAEFLTRLQKLVPTNHFDRIANTFSEKVPTTFRVNTLKKSVSDVRAELHQLNLRCDYVPWYPEAFILRSGRLRDLQTTNLYTHGEIYVQSLSSMLPPIILNPQADEQVLDLTAAPGSKTTQIAVMMGDMGTLVANDNNRVRFFRLKANVEIQGIQNIKLSLKYGESFGRFHADTFDKVLLDAPCSSEGRFFANEPKTYRYWKLRKVYEMARKQKKLIASAIQCLKPGGIMVYSTCTFAPEENEAVLGRPGLGATSF